MANVCVHGAEGGREDPSQMDVVCAARLVLRRDGRSSRTGKNGGGDGRISSLRVMRPSRKREEGREREVASAEGEVACGNNRRGRAPGVEAVWGWPHPRLEQD